MIRGGSRGVATAGHTSFDQDHPSVPGRAQVDGEFGSAISLLDLSDDGGWTSRWPRAASGSPTRA